MAEPLRLLLVSPDKASLSGFAAALEEQGGVALSWADSGEKALKLASEASLDLVVTAEMLGDMTGLELAGRLLRMNPAINTAAVSRLSPQEFHEASEGLGVMVQLPTRPGGEDARGLLGRLRELKELLGGA
ncbi:MAG: response regulator [Elusimicrobiota bacterium]